MLSASLLPATFNARDLGGLTAEGGIVRRGVVLRSDVPVALDDASRAVLRRVGVRQAIDLREPVERKLDPPDLASLGISVVSHPILGADFDVARAHSLEQVYVMILTRRGDRIAAAIADLAVPGGTPALIFCSAGKDRTGLVSAILLAPAGVRDDDIVADYHRTELNMRGDFRDAIVARAVAAGIDDQEVASKVGAPAELMRHVLEWLRQNYGDAGRYLRHYGLSADQLDALRDRLIEPAAEARCA